ncbi:MAG: zf-HC2 domain-containing protein [Acidimicrobiia bacterium]|nr:zf-HC2 domain-containing protein [Acidimicrobiia bacterium]
MTWHVETPLLDGYLEGRLDRAASASIETHITSCAKCRGNIAAPNRWIEDSWHAVADRVEPPTATLFERSLVALGVKAHTARILAVTPAIRLSWLAATVIATTFALTAITASDDRVVVALFLAIAPLIPVAGVALSYGQVLDPVHELSISAPIDKFRLLLIRSVAVLASSLVMLAAAQLATPVAGGAGAWLLPSLALSTLTLALATRVPPPIAGAGVTVIWTTFVATTAMVHQQTGPIYGGVALLAYAVLTVLAMAFLFAHRDSYNHRGGSP